MLHSLRRLFPEARIDVLANLGPHAVLEGNPDIDSVLIDYRTKMSGSRWKGLYYLPERLFRWLKWKAIGYDLVLVAHYGVHDHAIRLARSISAKKIVINVEAEYRKTYHDRRINFAPYKAGQHETIGVQTILFPWLRDAPGRMRLHHSEKISDPTGRKLRIGINLSASGQDRIWPHQLFQRLIATLSQEFNEITFGIVGHTSDVTTFEQLMANSSSSSPLVAYIHTPSLKTFIEAIASFDVFISGEGGATHMAAALQVPQVALFVNRPDKLKRWTPWSSTHVTLHAASDNAPVSDIDLATVLGACRTMIEQVMAEKAKAFSTVAKSHDCSHQEPCSCPR